MFHKDGDYKIRIHKNVNAMRDSCDKKKVANCRVDYEMKISGLN